MMPKTIEDKFRTVIRKNTYYFVNQDFEQRYEIYINSIRDRLLVLKNEIETDGLKNVYFEKLLLEKNGLTALLALTGFSNESFKRLLTVIRVLANDELNEKLYIDKWNSFEKISALYKLFKDLKLLKVEALMPIIEAMIGSYDEFASFNLSEIEKSSTQIRKDLKEQYRHIFTYIKRNISFKKIDIKRLTPDKIKELIDYFLLNMSIEVEEWTDEQVYFLIRNNKYFLKGLVTLFFKGSTLYALTSNLPLFELKKLSISKLSFKTEEIIDSLVRYKEKGSYSGNKENNAETAIEKILADLNIQWETGDLKDLIKSEAAVKRTMDFIIPSKKDPKLIIESSFLSTTSSGQGDKAKTEIQIRELISKYYPNAKFIGFVDGIGWYVRKGDLKRMVSAYEDVFTYHKDELKRFEQLLDQMFNL